MINKKAKLSGFYGIVGRTIAIYEGENDLGLGTGDAEAQSLIDGNAGKKVACCVVRATQPQFLPSGARCEAASPTSERPRCAIEHECCGSASIKEGEVVKHTFEICHDNL